MVKNNIRIQNGVGAVAGDIVDSSSQILKIAGISRVSQLGGHETFHGESDTENVVALADESLKHLISICPLELRT
jgi:hypothetical protein